MTAAHWNVGGGELGVCRVFWYRSPEKSGCEIKRADPTTWVSDDFLRRLFFNPEDCNPAVSLTRAPAGTHGSISHRVGEYEECDGVLAGGVCFYNNLLRIDGDNRTVIYRIGRYLHHGMWEAAWPD